MKRVAALAALLLALSGSAYAAAPKLWQGWTGGQDMQSNGGSLELSQGGSLMIDPGCINLEDNTAAPTHDVTVCNWGIRIVQYGPPLSRADVVTGVTDPTLGTDTDDPAASIYLQHKADGTGVLWFKTGPTDATWTCVAGC